MMLEIRLQNIELRRPRIERHLERSVHQSRLQQDIQATNVVNTDTARCGEARGDRRTHSIQALAA